MDKSKGQVDVSANKLTVKDVDTVLGLFRQLQDLSKPKLLPKNKKLWKQCQEKAREELFGQLKKHQSRLSYRNILIRKDSKIQQENRRKIILRKAEKKYRLMDSKYNGELLRVEKNIAELAKEIDHTLYPIREPLLKFDRAQGTLLEADWQKIRGILPVVEFTHLNFQFAVQKTIDALEAIKIKLKQQRRKNINIKNWCWTLYEKTVKAFFDSLLGKS